jgi:hypothetical protein
MMRDEIDLLKGQNVEMMANGLLYTGVLIEASEESISLQTSMQWMEIPMDQIAWIRGSST